MDVTKYMNKYRECVRNLWNVYFLNQDSPQDIWDIADQFDQVCTILFSIFILNQGGCIDYRKSCVTDKNPNPLFVLHVYPSPETGVPIKINREVNPSGYWDHPVDTILTPDVDLRFIDYFDFNLLGIRDFEFYRVRILDAPNELDIIGRDALIKTDHAIVKLQPENNYRKGGHYVAS
ncbi:MAG: hypothetical protein ABFR82_17390 [Nitrospirota bacterium]